MTNQPFREVPEQCWDTLLGGREVRVASPAPSPHPSCHKEPFRTSPLRGPGASSIPPSRAGAALALAVPVPTFPLPLSRHERKLEAQGAAAAAQRLDRKYQAHLASREVAARSPLVTGGPGPTLQPPGGAPATGCRPCWAT